MENIEAQIQKYKPNLCRSSIKVYITKLKRFMKDGEFDIKVFDKVKNILSHIESYPNISTRKSILTSIVVALNAQKRKKKKIIKQYTDEMMGYMHKENEESFKQEKTEKQTKSWISMDDFVNVINEMQTEIKEQGLMKQKLDNCQYSLLQDYLILRFYHEHPMRNDLASLIVVDNEDNIEEDKNYLVKSNPYKIILQNYKTSRHYGKKQYLINKNLEKIIKKLLQYNTTGYLLLNKNKKTRLTRNNLTLHLNRIFMKYRNKKIGSSLLRHIQASELNKEKSSLIDQQKQSKDIEDKFLHGGLMNQLYAKK